MRPRIDQTIAELLAERYGPGRNPPPSTGIHKRRTHRPHRIHRAEGTDDPQAGRDTVETVRKRRKILADALRKGGAVMRRG